MEKGIKLGVKLINDVSGLNFDKNSIKILKKYTPISLAKKVLIQEHKLYPKAILKIFSL